MQRVIHGVYAVPGPLLAQLALLEPPLPLIEGLGYDLEVGVAEEQADDSSVHLALLLIGLFRHIVSDVLLAVPLRAQEIFQGLHVTAHLVALEDHLPLGVDCLGELNAV